jgi:hypothetical protein
LRTGNYREIRPLERRPQESLRSAHANAASLIHFKAGTAGVVAAIEIVHLGNAVFRRSLAEGIEDLPRKTLLLDAPFAACAVDVICAAPVILRLLEDRQYVAPGPGVIAAGFCPRIVVTGLATHVDHGVDR